MPSRRENRTQRNDSDVCAARGALRREKVEELRERFANPYIAAERGYVDAVIMPHETRSRLIRPL